MRKHVMVDEEGEIVVTRFSNFGMPFIRYRTRDRAVYGGEVNGIVKLKKVLGRTADYIVNRQCEKLLISRHCFWTALSGFCKYLTMANYPGCSWRNSKINIIQLPGYSIKDETEISDIFKNIGGINSDLFIIRNL